MLPYSEIRSVIVRGLKSAIDIPLIQLNGGGKLPEGSFMTYNFPDGFGGEGEGQPIFTQQGDKQIRQETVTFTVSFLSYADTVDDSLVNAMKASDWFKGTGYHALKTLDIVVIDIGEVQNRDINIGEEWERRHGFEIELRATDIVESPLEWIEQIEVTKG